MQSLFGKTIDLLSDMLDYRAARHKVIVSNIANIDTPNYKPQELTFAASLAQAAGGQAAQLTKTDSKHLPADSGTEDRYELRQTGEKVEIDREMTSLSENNLMYNLTAELISRKFKEIDTVLKETR